MLFVRRDTPEARKPYEDRLTFSHRKLWERVRGPLGHERGEHLRRRRDEQRGKSVRKEIRERLLRSRREIADGRDHQASRRIARVWRRPCLRQREAIVGKGAAEQEDIV